jgi:hypothetical protein
MIIDLKTTPPLFLVGMGVLVIALAGAYYLINRSGKEFRCELKWKCTEIGRYSKKKNSL